jgi:hypothetical protein
MKSKTIMVLALVTAALIVGALFLSQPKEKKTVGEGERVFPELMDQVNTVTEMVVSAHNGSVTIVREQDVWKVKNKDNYRADMEKVRKTLIGLAELKLVEPKTKTPELYEKLGLQDIETQGSTATNLRVNGEDGTTLAEVIIGKRKPSKGQPAKEEMYLRKPGEPQTWLAMGTISLEQLPAQWVDKVILDLKPKRIHKVKVVHPDGSHVTYVKSQPEDKDFIIPDMPDVIKLKSQFSVNNVASTLANLSLDDMKPATEETVEIPKAVKAVLETFDGLRVTTFLQKKGDKTWVTLNAEFDQQLVQETPPEEPTNTEEEKDGEKKEDGTEGQETPETKPVSKKNPALKSAEDIQKEIEEINERVQGWVYAIPQFRADNITKKIEDQIEKKS